MAYLDTLADLIDDLRARAAYRQDRALWLEVHHAGDLCGEDVALAVPVLRQWLPARAEALPLAGSETIAPLPGEREIDAAVRAIDHLLARVEAAEQAGETASTDAAGATNAGPGAAVAAPATPFARAVA